MPLSLGQTYTAIKPDLTSSFLANGGTAPYTYSVLPDGIGGTIDGSTGVYTAPLVDTGVDTVQVEDSVGALATATIIVGNPLELFCEILETYMGLSQGQVIIWDQKFNTPSDSRLYIAVSVLSCKPFGTSTKMDEHGNSIQSVNMQAVLSVDILSRGPAARDLKEQVILALHSQYSQAQQEKNSFYVSPLSQSFLNLSQIDGAAIPYRFQIGVVLQYFVSNSVPGAYFDTFQNPEITSNP